MDNILKRFVKGDARLEEIDMLDVRALASPRALVVAASE